MALPRGYEYGEQNNTRQEQVLGYAWDCRELQLQEKFAMRKRVLAGLSTALIWAAPVFGHAKLLNTVPAADAQLSGAPASLTLTFNEDVRLAVLQLTTAGHDVPVTINRAAAAAPSVTIALPPLMAGKYEVQWSALTASDGHLVKGRYSFVIR
jgi:copper resistance protein C